MKNSALLSDGSLKRKLKRKWQTRPIQLEPIDLAFQAENRDLFFALISLLVLLFFAVADSALRI